MAGGKIKRKFGGKTFVAYMGFSNKRDAQAKAEKLRKTEGAEVRVMPAGKHDREAHGIKYEIYVR